ncbi:MULTISPECIES: hypothetical protein [unclassified Anabaena]|uniref:hypothetical protein n=1 Tax=unclassified Anabaena TaxID=2619674 RepID=UPI0039C6BD53
MNFFELHTAYDLFKKLEQDLQDLERSYQDARVAYNLFVTAEHLPDWLGKRDLVSKHAILRITSHLANGAKHFHLKDHRHNSIIETERYRVFEEDVFEPGVFYEPLIIYLSDKEAEELERETIDALTLAKKLIEFWKPYVQKPVTEL